MPPELNAALRRGELKKMPGDIAEKFGRGYIRSLLAFLTKTGYRT